MTPRSKRHHQVPAWHLKHFSRKNGKKDMLWVGSKDTRKIWQATVQETFFRKNANTRTDYRSPVDGDPVPEKSDKDEKILANFDSKAAPAVTQLISLARQWRDAKAPFLVDLETCKETIVVQARRAGESQDRTGLDEDKTDLYLYLCSKLAEEQGQQLPSTEDLLSDPRGTNLFNVLSQNHRAKFASGDHPILASKETEFLAPLGLNITVIGNPTHEFIIGSHGITIMETNQGMNTWLPVAPDVAISFFDRPRTIGISICPDEFVERHNRAALALSTQVAGPSKAVIEELLRTHGANGQSRAAKRRAQKAALKGARSTTKK